VGYSVITNLTKERINMEKYEQQKVKVEQLPDDFKMSDKQTLTLIRDLFEMVKDNNKLIELLTKRVKLLELKSYE
tara:strand:- start:230 stop:454 length:225 start_codon:yes stop_codon:yes gene_type:complete